MADVVKVQLPLVISAADTAPKVLIYAKGRIRRRVQDVSAEVMKVLEASPRHKAYYKATWDGYDWKLLERVADPGW